MNEIVRRLGYLGVGTKRLDQWESFAADVVGAQTANVNGRLLVQTDAFKFRIVIEEGAPDDVNFIGWEVTDPGELEALVARLDTLGIKVNRATTSELEARAVVDMVHFCDPSGKRVELFYGPTVVDELRLPRTLRDKFVTGALGMGHVTVFSNDVDQDLGFYVDSLGFRLSGLRQDVPLPSGGLTKIAVIRCNARHHSLGIIGLPADRRLAHFMIQFSELDELGVAYDKARSADIVEVTLGRHQGDHMLSFYARSPSGFQVELGWGGREVDEDMRVEQYEGSPSIWGHDGLL